MDGLLGVAGIIIPSDYGSFPHSLRLAPVSNLCIYESVQKDRHWVSLYSSWSREKDEISGVRHCVAEFCSILSLIIQPGIGKYATTMPPEDLKIS